MTSDSALEVEPEVAPVSTLGVMPEVTPDSTPLSALDSALSTTSVVACLRRVSAAVAAAAAFAASAALNSAVFFAAFAFLCRSRVRFVADDLTDEDGAVGVPVDSLDDAPEFDGAACTVSAGAGAGGDIIDETVDDVNAAVEASVNDSDDVNVGASDATLSSFRCLNGMKGDAFSSNCFLLLASFITCLGESEIGDAKSRFDVGNSVLLSIFITVSPISVTRFCRSENKEKR